MSKCVCVSHTNGGLTELLLRNLVGDVCSHEDRHGDAEFPLNDLWNKLQAVGAYVDPLEESD